MIRVRIDAVDLVGGEGDRLLDLARDAGLSLEGTCNGAMACGTCHVVVDPVAFPRLPIATADEEDLLDLLPGAARTSRLSCQLRLTAALDGLSAHVPKKSNPG